MAEILLQPNYLSKVIRIALDAKETDSTKLARLTTSRQFNTADTDAWLSFELAGLIETTGEYDLTLINTSEAPSSVVHHARIPFIGNVVHYKLDASGDLAKNEIRHAGRWVGQIVLRLSNGYTTSREFDFTIMGHLMDTAEARLILVEDYNALIATITASKDELTQYNVDYAALIADVTAAKEVMDQAEIDRQITFDALVDSEMIAQNVEIKLTEKERTYAPRLLAAEQQLADIENTKAEKDEVLSMANMVADIRSAMTGGIEADELLTGDGSLTYWQTVKGGYYYAVLGSVTEQPSPSGLVQVIRVGTDFSVLWHDLASQNVYRLYGSATVLSWWSLIGGTPIAFAPTLLNSWVNFGEGFAAAGYCKGPDNRVHLQGLIKSGTVADGTVIFTLLEGFRPKQQEIFIVFISGGGYGRVDVHDNGNVVAKNVNATYTSLSGISFLAEN